MTEPFLKPRRKNPLARTTQPLLPPSARGRKAHGLTLAAATGRFMLQCCGECGRYAYPSREACSNCLSSDLPFREAPTGGLLLSETRIEVTSDPYFREHMPWRTGLVQLDCGPIAVVHLHGDCGEPGSRLTLSLQLDRAGQAVFFAKPVSETPHMEDDPQWREMTADPKHRRILITDGRSPLALPLAQALGKVGAARIFVGVTDRWRPFDQQASLEAIEGVEIVDLDLTSERSVQELSMDIGAKVEILINTADHVRPAHLFDVGAANIAREAMDYTVMGLMRLAQAFGPVMCSRGADGAAGAVAWVNVLSVHGLSNAPQFGVHSAAHAACLSLSQWLRTELRPGGIRVINAFTGPLDAEWFQTVPPPKVAPKALADAVLDGLKRGLEDIYVGDVAKDIEARLFDNPKAVEREAGQ
ncbi:Short chain dehydrogenase family protein 17 [Neorhizobium galegae bv. officinalis]|uniref:Short chain dehydrogenase family protein 17 n=1 Tax=Neorhizobium galegae bv. officinalis TaxID=323656 RepID=A0A0T7FBE8_NEOGA|nr:SDR family NAD(P)-dependent oxidoreductase [Neorhizobium galegae]CDZ32271.1 Short chain dehydrogenase family protein 17 [Neorhizobium galegae bv. officinalis]